MRLSELDYELPPELIAQEPLARRDEARMEVLDRRTGAVEHARFYKLDRYLREGDLIVLNDTKVFPARLHARKESGGRIELLMVRPFPEVEGAWLALVHSHRPVKEGSELILADDSRLRLLGYHRPGRAILVSANSRSIAAMLEQTGLLALPHYIRREVEPADAADYQTIYATHQGAVAAPTAGLHFSEELMAKLTERGVRTTTLTLHIGPGTFVPIRNSEVETHHMEAEWYAIPESTAAALAHARRTGGRVIGVGTSAARALESYAITGDRDGYTGLFIRPGFRFKMLDAMITNFHMPRTTVLALVMAFAGRDLILEAYRDAIRHRYRFLSYGDGMLIL